MTSGVDRAYEPDAARWEALVEGIRARRVRDVARAITMVENQSPDGQALMEVLALRGSGRSRTIGLTGAPGVGKSTMTAALIAAYRQMGLSVGVLAVDPSSPFSGGALLGDRIRMQSHSADSDVFIRSMASRGHLGGLAATAGQVLRVYDTAGFDVVLIETVGVGQSEVEIAAAADTTVVLVAPGMGDGIQAAKAGILEIGDVFVVNKADREGAQSTARDLRQMIALADSGSAPTWIPPVAVSVASTGDGISDVVSAIDAHYAWAQGCGELERRRVNRAREEIVSELLRMVRTSVAAGAETPALFESAHSVATGQLTVHRAAETLWQQLRGKQIN
jgi:LAO/AO transport system kinase